MNTSRSAQHHAESSRYLAMGVSSGMRTFVTDPPLFFERAEGPYYFDVDGNKLLDHTLAWGPLILGSNHPQLNKAVIEALQKSYTLGAQHPGEIALARRMTEVIPGVEQVVFSNTGTEAVQTALRFARTFTGRTKFVKFEGHYHGWANNILLSYHAKEADSGPIESPHSVPSMGGQPASEYAEAIVLPWNRLDLLAQAFEKHGGEIAAVFTEPLLANSGSIEPVDGFLQGLVDLCKSHGALSVFDEVITGFRLALGGAREFYGVIPDLSVYAKALAAGFTLSAVGGRRDIFDVIRDGRTIHAGTYNGNTISLAAGLATLDILSADSDNHNRMHLHGLQIRKTLEEEALDRGLTLCTSGCGTVFNAHFGTSDSLPGIRPPRYEHLHAVSRTYAR
ncbi:MAG: aminotransferase class III-fold pyridoxal phosphate-dependent enzyme [bacterium]|nr:aminotransferase class III-fold pyridoxal phosphate-dependent enzyme [bacterium]